MNIRSTKSWLVKSTVAMVLAGVVALGSGCEAVDGMLAIAKTTATEAVAESVSGVIGGAVEGVLGGIIPGAGGS